MSHRVFLKPLRSSDDRLSKLSGNLHAVIADCRVSEGGVCEYLL